MRKCNTRSHSELGSQAFQRRWYFVLRHGRVVIARLTNPNEKNYCCNRWSRVFGSNLIQLLLKKSNHKIISLDNYSSGTKKNHISNRRVKYFKGDTKKINLILGKLKKEIHTIFHFGEFARIYQSFVKFNQCYESNSIGTKEVFKFCLDNKIKLIYSATSASLGNREKIVIFHLMHSLNLKTLNF